MIEAEHIEQWRGQSVIDPAGEQLGKLDEIYFDSASGAPVLIAIKSGLLGRHSKLVPLDGCSVGRDYVRVSHSKESIETAEESDAEGAPDQATLTALGSTYGLRFSDGLDLESAAEREAHQAQAEAARRRAAELDSAAHEKLDQRDAAKAHAHGAVVNADQASREAEQAEREAEQARQAALEARETADKYGRE